LTTLSKEKKEQRKWVFKQGNSPDSNNIFETLVESEFLSTGMQRKNQEQYLAGFIRFAAMHTQYYREMFQQLGLQPQDIQTTEDLHQIPLLTKKNIQEQPEMLIAEKLPLGEKYAGWSQSSGTTGKPLRVFRSARSCMIEVAMLQRQFRWYRLDPRDTQAWFRRPDYLPVPPDNHHLRHGETLYKSTWPGLGKIFVTGPCLAFSLANPTDTKIEWLKQHKPAFLRTVSSELERLALAFQGQPPIKGLKGFRAVGERLTPGMHHRIEKTFGVPVNISYGLNELGWNATRCSEGGRYHINSESCLIEVIKDDGTPSEPGELGTVVITQYDNVVMPLIRYNTGDIARAVDGTCPCGRTLPAVGDIIGRSTERSSVPAAILQIADKLREMMELLPEDLSFNIRGYQVHHHQTNDFSLRLLLAAPLPEGFNEYVRNTWENILTDQSQGIEGKPSLSIEEVDVIPQHVSGKQVYFTSDLKS
jgi:phenylacetate-CoA ligase